MRLCRHDEKPTPYLYMQLMVEQADTRKCHGNIIFITCFDDMVVAYGTTPVVLVVYSALMCTFDIIAKGEERIRT